jgi:DNA repair exonuclease SbcCD ATPase subunit
MINATLRDIIICSACGALVYLPTVRVYNGYIWSGKCCPVCKEPLSESLKPNPTEKIEPLVHETRWDMDKQIVKKINEVIDHINKKGV